MFWKTWDSIAAWRTRRLVQAALALGLFMMAVHLAITLPRAPLRNHANINQYYLTHSGAIFLALAAAWLFASLYYRGFWTPKGPRPADIPRKPVSGYLLPLSIVGIVATPGLMEPRGPRWYFDVILALWMGAIVVLVYALRNARNLVWVRAAH